MTTCLKCQSTRVTTGTFHHEGGLAFQPDNLKWHFSWNGGAIVEQAARACLDCGLVWGSTSPAELSEYVRKHGR